MSVSDGLNVGAESLVAGDSGVIWEMGVDGETDLTGYTCRIEVPGTDIARDVTDTNGDGSAFLVQLLPAETATLRPGGHILGVQIDKLPAFSRESQIAVTVRAGVVT